MGKIKHINKYATYGLAKMSGVAILLIGTGTLAGIIANSGLKDVIISGINALGLPSFMLAPVSGILMSAATASTTSGTAVATSVFGPTIVQLGSGTTCYSSYDTCWGYSFRSLTSWKLLPRYWWKCFNGYERET